jgi:hypothetical protein
MRKQLVIFITCGCESSSSFFCNLQSRVGTHAVLMICLYEWSASINVGGEEKEKKPTKNKISFHIGSD